MRVLRGDRRRIREEIDACLVCKLFHIQVIVSGLCLLYNIGGSIVEDESDRWGSLAMEYSMSAWSIPDTIRSEE
jgi:hypothetical protein